MVFTMLGYMEIFSLCEYTIPPVRVTLMVRLSRPELLSDAMYVTFMGFPGGMSELRTGDRMDVEDYQSLLSGLH